MKEIAGEWCMFASNFVLRTVYMSSGSRIGRQPNSIKHATMVELQQIKVAKGIPLDFEIRSKTEPVDMSTVPADDVQYVSALAAQAAAAVMAQHDTSPQQAPAPHSISPSLDNSHISSTPSPPNPPPDLSHTSPIHGHAVTSTAPDLSDMPPTGNPVEPPADNPVGGTSVQKPYHGLELDADADSVIHAILEACKELEPIRQRVRYFVT